jgi:hypothetical protein
VILPAEARAGLVPASVFKTGVTARERSSGGFDSHALPPSLIEVTHPFDQPSPPLPPSKAVPFFRPSPPFPPSKPSPPFPPSKGFTGLPPPPRMVDSWVADRFWSWCLVIG